MRELTVDDADVVGRVDTLRALNVIAPVRSGSPEAVPVYLPLVIVIVLPSVVVHVRVDVLLRWPG